MEPNNSLQKVQSLKDILSAESVQAQFKNALNENSGSFVASIIDLYSGDNYLQQCEPKLVVMQALKAAVLKLPINKSLGFAYIVPYKSNNVQLPQFQIGYKGLIQLAIRTGQYLRINADVVFEGELKRKDKLTGEIDLTGTPTSEREIGYFAYFELKSGFSKMLYMTKEQVDAHAKKYSKSYNQQFSPWKTEFKAMALKTLLRNLLGHYGYLSVEMVNAFDTDPDEDTSNRVRETIRTQGNNGSHVDFAEHEEVKVNNNHSQQTDEPDTAPF